MKEFRSKTKKKLMKSKNNGKLKKKLKLKSRKGGVKRDDPLFLIILHQIINDSNYNSIVSWDDVYERFVILDLISLQKLLGKYDLIESLKQFNFYISNDFWGLIYVQHPLFKKETKYDEILKNFS